MRLRLLLPTAAGLLLAACATVPLSPSPVATAPGMVSAADPRAAEAGAEMLRLGGSAADAALATMLALTVVEPQSSGIGGGSFLVYEDGDGTPDTYDGRETAPTGAGSDWFFRDGKLLTIGEAIPGGKSVGVPGNLRLMADAHKAHGRLPWKTLFGPAIRLARDGFRVTPRLNSALDSSARTAALTTPGRSLYYGSDNKALPVGSLIRNPDLASFLEQLSERGGDSFYVGPNARSLVDTVNAGPTNPSRMTVGDVASYDAKQRPPLCGKYRGYRICGMGPPSSGATTVLAILKQLERFDLRGLGPRSPTSWHLLAESMRLAFADRDRYLADPDFVRVPVAGLISSDYLRQRSALIDPQRTLATVTAGTPLGAPALASSRQQPEAGTSHFVAVDRWGHVASHTSTIESAFGSGLIVNGYYLNNELTDFNFVPFVDNTAVANRVEGGKRPRSSMAPTIVYGPDGKVRLAVGAAGGATIIAQVAKAIIGVVDWNLPAQDALALPVLFAPTDTVFLERGSFLEAMAPALQQLGHAKIDYRVPRTFKGNAVEWRNGRWVGAADPRSEGAAVSQ